MKMTLKAKLSELGRLLNWHVCVIPSAVVTQAVAAASAYGVIIDQEHETFASNGEYHAKQLFSSTRSVE